MLNTTTDFKKSRSIMNRILTPFFKQYFSWLRFHWSHWYN